MPTRCGCGSRPVDLRAAAGIAGVGPRISSDSHACTAQRHRRPWCDAAGDSNTITTAARRGSHPRVAGGRRKFGVRRRLLDEQLRVVGHPGARGLANRTRHAHREQQNRLGRALLCSAQRRPCRCSSSTTAIRRRRCLTGIAYSGEARREDLFTVVFRTGDDRYGAARRHLLLPATTFLQRLRLRQAYRTRSPRSRATGHRARRRRAVECRRLWRNRGTTRRAPRQQVTGWRLDLMLSVIDALPAPIGDDLRNDRSPAPACGT